MYGISKITSRDANKMFVNARRDFDIKLQRL